MVPRRRELPSTDGIQAEAGEPLRGTPWNGVCILRQMAPADMTHLYCLILHSIYFGPSLLAQLVKNLPAMQETQARSLEEEMAMHSIIPAWEIPWTEEPGKIQSMGSKRVKHD